MWETIQTRVNAEAHPGFGNGTATTGGEAPSRRRPRGSGGVTPAANRFFHKKKTLILARFFIDKGHAVSESLWTMRKYSRSLCLKAEAWLK